MDEGQPYPFFSQISRTVARHFLGATGKVEPCLGCLGTDVSGKGTVGSGVCEFRVTGCNLTPGTSFVLIESLPDYSKRANTLSKITLCEEAEVKGCWLLLDPEGLE